MQHMNDFGRSSYWLEKYSLGKRLVVQLFAHGLAPFGLLPECQRNLIHWHKQVGGALLSQGIHPARQQAG